MVKLRGINIFPQAIGPLLEERPEFTGEFLCRVERIEGREELTVIIEVATGTADHPALLPVYREFLKNKLGITVQVELVAPGALRPLTGIETRQKPIRLLDRRT